jgi:hypothetical protein
VLSPSPPPHYCSAPPTKAVSAFQRRPSAKDLLLQASVLDAIAQYQSSTWKVRGLVGKTT